MEDALLRCEKYMQEVEVALAKRDGEGALRRWAALTEAAKLLLEDEGQRWNEVREVQRFLSQYRARGRTINGEAEVMVDYEFAMDIVRRCNTFKAQVDAAEKKGDGEAMLKAWRRLEDMARPLLGGEREEAYAIFEEVTALRDTYQALAPIVVKESDRLVRLQSAQEVLRPLNALIDAIRRGLAGEKGLWGWGSAPDGETIQKQWAELRERAQQVRTPAFQQVYGEIEAVQLFLAAYEALSQTADGEVEGLIREKEAKALHAACTKHLEETKAAIKASRGEAAEKGWRRLCAGMQPLLEDGGRYDALDDVQALKRKFRKLQAGGAEDEIRTLIHRNQAPPTHTLSAQCAPSTLGIPTIHTSQKKLCGTKTTGEQVGCRSCLGASFRTKSGHWLLLA